MLAIWAPRQEDRQVPRRIFRTIEIAEYLSPVAQLDNAVSFDQQAGSLVTLLGPSGCGKTTFLKIAGGLIRATSGVVRIAGKDVYEPQPDFALLRPKPGGYLGGKPRPEDVFLLIKLSDSTLRFDRMVKLPLYGAHGIREFWILNLGQRVVEVCRGPRAEGYASVETHGLDAVLEPEALPGLRVRVAELLP